MGSGSLSRGQPPTPYWSAQGLRLSAPPSWAVSRSPHTRSGAGTLVDGTVVGGMLVGTGASVEAMTAGAGVATGALALKAQASTK